MVLTVQKTPVHLSTTITHCRAFQRHVPPTLFCGYRLPPGITHTDVPLSFSFCSCNTFLKNCTMSRCGAKENKKAQLFFCKWSDFSCLASFRYLVRSMIIHSHVVKLFLGLCSLYKLYRLLLVWPNSIDLISLSTCPKCLYHLAESAFINTTVMPETYLEDVHYRPLSFLTLVFVCSSG